MQAFPPPPGAHHAVQIAGDNMAGAGEVWAGNIPNWFTVCGIVPWSIVNFSVRFLFRGSTIEVDV